MRSRSYFLGILFVRVLIIIFISVSSILILIGPGLCYQDSLSGYNYGCENFSVDYWSWVNNFVYIQIVIIVIPFCMSAASLAIICSIKCCECHLSRMGHLIISGVSIAIYIIAAVLETIVYFNIPDSYDDYDLYNWFNSTSQTYVRGYLASAVFLMLSAILSMIDIALVAARRTYYEDNYH
uniref:G_PROTEIN_RECEP_F1_2 domain-containing protein n=1 Tax=Parastrongyloides trichosuri TaxID=131310 RepID=A0A0N4Z6W8_PARTI